MVPSIQNSTINYKSQEPKSIYKADTRYNLNNLQGTNPAGIDFLNIVKHQAKSVAALVYRENLKVKRNGDYKFNALPTLNQIYQNNLRDDVPFKQEPEICYGTGFLAGKQKLLSAGHCFINKNIAKQASYRNAYVVFDVQLGPNGQLPPVIPKDNVYQVAQIKEAHYDDKCIVEANGSHHYRDWSIVKLDRKVIGREPLKFSFSPVQYNAGKTHGLYMLGYPSGLPLKLTTDGYVQTPTYSFRRFNQPEEEGKLEKESYPTVFSHDLPAFGGNSGSPVFSRTTNKVVGILVSGNDDFHIDEATGQWAIYHVTADDIRDIGHETCMQISQINFGKLYISATERRKDKKNSDVKSIKSASNFKNYFDHKKCNQIKAATGVTAGGLTTFFFGLGIPALVYSSIKLSQANEDLAEYKKSKIGVQAIQNQFPKLNFDQAYLIHEHLALFNQGFSEEMICLMARNMSSHNLTFEAARGLTELELQLNKKFPLTDIIILIKYENALGISFPLDTRRRILNELAKQDPSALNVQEARVQACIKTTQKEALYAYYPLAHIVAISRYYVQNSPNVTFEQAREILNYPAPLIGGVI